MDAPDEVSQVREDSVLEQATGGSLALDNGCSDHRGVAREQFATPDDSHEQPKRQAFKKRRRCVSVAGVMSLGEDVASR